MENVQSGLCGGGSNPGGVDGARLGKPQQDQTSVCQQLEHLDHELSAVSIGIDQLGSKLAPVMTPPHPRECGDKDSQRVSQAEYSPVMTHAIALTSRLRELNARLCHLTEDIEL